MHVYAPCSGWQGEKKSQWGASPQTHRALAFMQTYSETFVSGYAEKKKKKKVDKNNGESS